jgi:hypothetical protein
MTRDEERRVDDLPEERGTMSARDAVIEAMWEVLPGYYDSEHSAPAHFVDDFITELRAIGFGIYQLHPEPKVT